MRQGEGSGSKAVSKLSPSKAVIPYKLKLENNVGGFSRN